PSLGSVGGGKGGGGGGSSRRCVPHKALTGAQRTRTGRRTGDAVPGRPRRSGVPPLSRVLAGARTRPLPRTTVPVPARTTGPARPGLLPGDPGPVRHRPPRPPAPDMRTETYLRTRVCRSGPPRASPQRHKLVPGTGGQLPDARTDVRIG